MLFALLQPDEQLKEMQDGGDFTRLMASQEDMKVMPFGDIWNEYCLRCGAPRDGEWYETIMDHEKKVLEVRK